MKLTIDLLIILQIVNLSLQILTSPLNFSAYGLFNLNLECLVDVSIL